MLRREDICAICHSKTNYTCCCSHCEAARPIVSENVEFFLCQRCDNCKPLAELAIGVWWCRDCAKEVLSVEEYYVLSMDSLEDEPK